MGRPLFGYIEIDVGDVTRAELGKVIRIVSKVPFCQNTSQWRSTYCVTISSFNLHNSHESCCPPALTHFM